MDHRVGQLLIELTFDRIFLFVLSRGDVLEDLLRSISEFKTNLALGVLYGDLKNFRMKFQAVKIQWTRKIPCFLLLLLFQVKKKNFGLKIYW